MDEVQRAIGWLEDTEKQNRLWEKIFYLNPPESNQYAEAAANCRILLDALKWIPVSERLPMEEPDGRHSASKMVLVYAYNGYSDRFASTDITVDGKWYDYSEPEFEVTHWMPLPEPPKSEG